MLNDEENYVFYKEHEKDRVWWVEIYFGRPSEGKRLRFTPAVSFDKKKVLFLFRDYPWNFTKEEKELFDKENPYWTDFFKERVK